MTRELVKQVRSSGIRFHQVVGIANGGLPVSVPIADALGLPHTSVRISHYDGRILRDTPIIQGELRHLTHNLVVDDLIDEGWTYNTYAEHFGFELSAMAVLFWNTAGPEPDFYVEEKPDDWIVFPWETAECGLKNT
jgi:hypoxanthine phosphoribosyltransferase